mmetsp:Transcript_8556/g.19499  ORF Transcript_8556/g.19499 Transcript_8556/m.19499 type:complete len:432 (+) Transcript_8556:97-1392(+)
MKAVYHGVTVMIGILLLCGGGNGADAFGFYGGAFPNRNRNIVNVINPPAPPPPPPTVAAAAARVQQQQCPDPGRCIQDMCNIDPELLRTNGYPPCTGIPGSDGFVCPYPCTFGEIPRPCVLSPWSEWTDLSNDPNACFCNDPQAKTFRYTNNQKGTDCLIWAQQRTRGIQTPVRNGGPCDLSEENTRETRPCPDRLLPDLSGIEASSVALGEASCPARSASAQATCGQPPLLLNGRITRVASCDFPGGFTTYQCDPGYTLLGSSFVWCEGTSEWSSPLPLCQASVAASGMSDTATTSAAEVSSLQNLQAFLANVYFEKTGQLPVISSDGSTIADSDPEIQLATTRGGSSSRTPPPSPPPPPIALSVRGFSTLSPATDDDDDELAELLEDPVAIEEILRTHLPEYDAIKDSLLRRDFDTLESKINNMTVREF